LYSTRKNFAQPVFILIDAKIARRHESRHWLRL
jgi:hypothetical protein